MATRADVVAVLKALEWSGRTQGPGTSMGREDGYWYAACPYCGGLKERSPGFSSFAWGHQRDCVIAEATRRKT